MSNLPKIFIGSSTESLDLAGGLRIGLSHAYDPVLWTESMFKPSSFTVVDLINSVKEFDAAVFVFSPDDITALRDGNKFTVRDNVIFECGLFMGVLGLGRTFFVIPRGEKELHLPSDLKGVNPLEYTPRIGAAPQQVMGNAVIELVQLKQHILSISKP